jgi:hypothetical protein
MSTKTLRKRIALVAVSALGAGLLSVVAVPTASAAVNANVTTGVATASGSVGLLASAGTGTTQTAVLLATGAISTTGAAGGASTTMTATITGGKFTAVDAGVISGTSGASAYDTSANSALSLLAVPNAGATTMVITYSKNDAGTYTVTERITVTVVATSAYNKYAATYSSVYWGDGAYSTSNYSATTDATSSKYTKERAGTIAGAIVLADAYGNALTSSNTGILQVSVTGGALVGLGSASAVGDNSSAYAYIDGASLNVDDGNGILFNIQQEDTDVPANGTVTVTFGGTVVATKSYVIKGEVAKITAGLAKIGTTQSGGSNAAAAYVKFEDSAGNQVLPDSGLSAVSSTLGAVVTSITAGTYSTSTSDAAGGMTPVTVLCAASGTQKAVQVQILNASGTIVKSNAWDAGCAGAPVKMTASLDKASYKRGEVATLTLTVKDAKGNAGNAYDTIATAAEDLTFAGTPGTIVTAVAAGAKPSYSTGAKTYQFTVGNEDGDYNLIVTPTTVKTNDTSGAQGNLTVPYSITSTAGVTNADVLKAIVSLIASINKQIAALQKALLKR